MRRLNTLDFPGLFSRVLLSGTFTVMRRNGAQLHVVDRDRFLPIERASK
jgi:hypothetical protein